MDANEVSTIPQETIAHHGQRMEKRAGTDGFLSRFHYDSVETLFCQLVGAKRCEQFTPFGNP